MAIAWVTGARGFIGRRLVLHLRNQGFAVSGIGHGHLAAESWPQAGLCSWSNSEITAAALDQLATDRDRPDLVFHLAGGSAVGASLQAPFEDFTRTTNSTARLLEWLRAHSPQTKVVVASSAAVYGDTGGAAARESLRPAPVSPYGYHKLMMEQLCQEYAQVFGLQTAVLRLFSVYGEGLRKQLLWDCGVKLMADGDCIELGGNGAELRDWVHIDDAVAMLHRVAGLASAACPVFNGGSGVGVRVRDIVALLAKSLQRPKRIEFSQICRRGDPSALVADAARISALGHRCHVSLNVGVQRYADWFTLSRNE
jgi:UDP-glucose 4-epimerase